MEKRSWWPETLQIIRNVFARSAAGGKPDGHTRQNRRMFLREFVAIFIVCFILVMTLIGYYTRSLSIHQEKSRLETAKLYLNSAAEYTSSILSGNLEKALDYVYHAGPVISLSLSTANHQILGTTIARVRSDLQAAVSNADPFSNAVLFVPKADLCVSSSYVYGRVNELPVRFYTLIETYKQGLAPKQLMALNNENVQYFSCDGIPYFAAELLTYEGEPQSILFIQLDSSAIYQKLAEIFSVNAENLPIYAYDCFRRPLWSDLIAYPDEQNPDGMLVVQSDWLGWTLSMPYPAGQSTSLWLMQHIPFVLLLVSALLVISLFVSAFMFRPVYHVSKALEEIDLPIPEDFATEEDQLDDLGRSISRISAYQKELDAALQSVSGDVLTKLFRCLLDGTPVSYAMVEKTLQGIRSKFSVSGLYVAIAVALENGMEVPEEMVRITTDYIASYEATHGSVTCTALRYPERQGLAFILEFQNVDTAIVTGKKETMTFMNALADLLYRKGYACCAANGHLYHSVMDIGFSYKEASDAIHSGTPEESNEKAAPVSDMRQQAQRIIEWICQGDMAAAQSLILPTVDQLLEGQPDAAHTKEACLDFLLALLNEIGLYEFIDTSALPDEYTRISENEFPVNASEQRELVLSAVTTLLSAFDAAVSRQNNPHIAQAREYIQSHLSDRNLSLSSMAEALGMSGSYLSRLFSKNLNINYSSYVNQMRIQASLKELLSTENTISAISERYGFSSVRNYIYAFKKQYRMTPGEYRSRYGT